MARALPLLASAILAAAAAAPAGAAPGDVASARAERDALSAETAAALDRLVAVAAEAEELGRRLDRVDRLLAAETATEDVLRERIASGAADAYMAAVGGGSAILLDQGSVEGTLVAVELLARVHADSVSELADLAAHLDSLDALRTEESRLLGELAARRELLGVQVDDLRSRLTAADAAVAAHDEAAGAEAARQPATETVTTRSADGRDAPSGTGPPPPTRPVPSSVEYWRPAVARYFPDHLVDGALAVMDCESGGDPGATNPWSGAAGLFQFLPETWAVVAPLAGAGSASPLDGEANIAAAAWLATDYEKRTGDPWRPWGCGR